MEELLKKIGEKIKDNPLDFQAYADYYAICIELVKNHKEDGVKHLKHLSEEIEKAIGVQNDMQTAQKMFALHKSILLTAAPYDFEAYLLYVEWNREPKKKFYPPRKKVLQSIVAALQKLADGDLDLLAISLPPGVGKTTIAIFFLTWLAGKNPNEPILTGSHSTSFVRGVYDECLRIMSQEGEYLWNDVFPNSPVIDTNAKDLRIDLDQRQRFETLEFTSIGTGNAGLYRAAQLLYCDDLVSGIEVAMSKDRLDKLWELYTTDLRQRKIGDHCRELHIATRWSLHDVIGRLESANENNERAEFITIPAMNEYDESNFDYDYGVGFTTEFYRNQRDIMAAPNWRALYMNEPIEREGVVYTPDEMRRFYELPKNMPDYIAAVCDSKDKGEDYAVLLVAYVYGDDYYIYDCICDNGLPDKVDGRLVNILLKNNVALCQFESNNAGRRTADKVQEEIYKNGGFTKITKRTTTSNKETRILIASAWVKKHCLFLEESLYKRFSDYGKMMNMLFQYTLSGKNKHDDVPDALAMMSEINILLHRGKAEIFSRMI